jgi:Glycosyl transferase family 2
MPRFSVVVPTRDRPYLLAFCLESLASQTFTDVEVVVADNPTSAPAREVFDRFARPGWRYLPPGAPLAMHDNFERAVDAATGDHVAIVIDKTLLHPSALAIADRALRAQPADIVTWHNEGYDPLDEARDPARGRFVPVATPRAPVLYDPAAELAVRFANSSRRGLDPVHYVRGKIVFGAFSRSLLDRIRDCTGRVFHPLSPDYTSMVPACVLGESALDVGRPLLISYNSVRSNGRRASTDPAHSRRFIEAADPALIEALPIPGLYASSHNVVAYDLASSAARLPAGSTPPLDMPNLVRRAREDMAGVGWTNAEEHADQLELLAAAERRYDAAPAPAPPVVRARPERRWLEAALAFKPVRRVASRLTDRIGAPPATHASPLDAAALETYASPLDAAEAADRYYAALRPQ